MNHQNFERTLRFRVTGSMPVGVFVNTTQRLRDRWIVAIKRTKRTTAFRSLRSFKFRSIPLGIRVGETARLRRLNHSPAPLRGRVDPPVRKDEHRLLSGPPIKQEDPLNLSI